MDNSGFGHGLAHDDEDLPSTDDPNTIVKAWTDDEPKEYDVKLEHMLQWQFEMAEILKLKPNPYLWQVRPENQIPQHLASQQMTPGVSDALAHFGRPTTDTVKLYTDLGARVAFDLKGAKALSDDTKRDLFLMLEASKPLNFGQNDALGGPWSEANDSYGGSKTQIPLYGHLRSEMTKSLKAVPIFVATPAKQSNLNDVLKMWNGGKPFEIHHVNYKAVHPELATDLDNLMLTQRSIREREDGPGQHELMHMVASGLSKDKFNVLAPQFTEIFVEWNNATINMDDGQ